MVTRQASPQKQKQDQKKKNTKTTKMLKQQPKTIKFENNHMLTLKINKRIGIKKAEKKMYTKSHLV